MTAPDLSPAEAAIVARFDAAPTLPEAYQPSLVVALLDQLDELRAKATPGPWAQHSADHEYVIGEVGEDEDGNLSYLDVADCYGYRSQRGTADAALIVGAVNALPELIAELWKHHAAVRAVLAVCAEIEQEQADAAALTFHGLGQLSAISKIRAALSVTP